MSQDQKEAVTKIIERAEEVLSEARALAQMDVAGRAWRIKVMSANAILLDLIKDAFEAYGPATIPPTPSSREICCVCNAPFGKHRTYDLACPSMLSLGEYSVSSRYTVLSST